MGNLVKREGRKNVEPIVNDSYSTPLVIHHQYNGYNSDVYIPFRFKEGTVREDGWAVEVWM